MAWSEIKALSWLAVLFDLRHPPGERPRGGGCGCWCSTRVGRQEGLVIPYFGPEAVMEVGRLDAVHLASPLPLLGPRAITEGGRLNSGFGGIVSLTLSWALRGSWVHKPFGVPRPPPFLFLENRLQPPGPALSSKGQNQTVVHQGRKGMQRRGRSRQETIVGPWGRCWFLLKENTEQ